MHFRINKHHNSKVITLLGLFLLLLIVSPAEAQMLSLSDAIQYGMEHNDQLLRQKEVILQKEYDLAAMKGNFLPKVSVAGGYTYLSENMRINMDQVKGSLDDVLSKYGVAIASEIIPFQTSPEFQAGLYNALYGSLSSLPTFDVEIDNQHMPTANIVAMQPIFMGGKIIAGTKFAKAESEEAHYELIKLSNEVSQSIIKRYLTVVLLQDVVKTRNHVVQGVERHHQEAKKAIEIGVVPPHVLLRAKVALSNANRKLKDDKNNLKLAMLALKTEMGMKDDTLIQICDHMKFNLHGIMLDSSMTDALAHQPIFKILEQKKSMVKQNYNVKRSEMMPKIFAWGEYGFFREELPIIQPPVMLGVQVKMTLFNGFSKINELKSARHLQYEVERAEDYAENQVKLWVHKSYYQIENSKEKYIDMQSTIMEAQENVNILEKRFSEGLSPSLEVIDARLLLEAELIEELATLFEYYNALAEFYTATAQPEKILDIFNHTENANN